jgi:hypothetical protein
MSTILYSLSAVFFAVTVFLMTAILKKSRRRKLVRQRLQKESYLYKAKEQGVIWYPLANLD